VNQQYPVSFSCNYDPLADRSRIGSSFRDKYSLETQMALVNVDFQDFLNK